MDLPLLRASVEQANARVHAAASADRSKKGMGTTLSALLVLEDADIDQATMIGAWSAFHYQGQTCITAGRHIVTEGIARAYTDGLAKRASAITVGNTVTQDVGLGPMINQRQLDRGAKLPADAVAGGARIEVGGHRHPLGRTYFEPTVVTGVKPSMAISREEIFGPVATLTRFKDDAEAIRLANDTDFGLAAYFYARDMGRIFRVAEALEYGMVAVNDGILSTEVAPFGGVKQSGLGREGSKYGIEDYLEIKYLTLGGIGT